MQQNSVYQICGYVYDNHYFHNKLELYIFLWDQAEKLTREAKEKYKVYETDDIFEILRLGLAAKCMLMRKYYYISLFSINAFYEDEPTIKEIIEKRIRSGTDDAYQTIARIINRDNLREDAIGLYQTRTMQSYVYRLCRIYFGNWSDAYQMPYVVAGGRA